ncbi:NUDIX hydrolase [Kitasatospora cystarginea]|uniref:NUDIX hydrolase n=1 Tax=Kitasatospora cystarginea TaxID=58350 RepID=UPI0031D36C9E
MLVALGHRGRGPPHDRHDDPLRHAEQEEDGRGGVAGVVDAGLAQEPRLLHSSETDDERQDFYLATIDKWNFENRTGPEFSQEGRGEYILEEVPLTPEALNAVNLLPQEIAAVLREAVEHGELFAAK